MTVVVSGFIIASSPPPPPFYRYRYRPDIETVLLSPEGNKYFPLEFSNRIIIADIFRTHGNIDGRNVAQCRSNIDSLPFISFFIARRDVQSIFHAYSGIAFL